MNLETPRRGGWLIALMLAALLAGCGDSDTDDHRGQLLDRPGREWAPSPSELRTEQMLLERLKANPSDVEAALNLGNLYYDGDRPHRAIPLYLRVLQARPDDPNVRTDLGTCYRRTFQFENAKKEFERVLEKDPTKLQAIFNLAVVSRDLGDLDRAAKLWDKVILLAPDSDDARSAAKLAAETRLTLEKQKAAGAKEPEKTPKTAPDVAAPAHVPDKSDKPK